MAKQSKKRTRRKSKCYYCGKSGHLTRGAIFDSLEGNLLDIFAHSSCFPLDGISGN